MYRIGEFSKMTKTTIKTLRYYDEAGLLTPAYVDEVNGYRFYTTEQLLPLHHIIALRQAGLSIPEISAVLSGQNARAILEKRKAETEQEEAAVRERLSRLDFMLSNGQEDYLMNYQAIVKELPAGTVYYKQGTVPTFADYAAFILQSAEECKAANPGIRCVEPDYCFVSYLDPEYREENIAIQYAQLVEKAGVETETIRFKHIDSVTAVCVFHRGSYDKLRDAYAFAYKWAKDNGYEPVESSRESYIDGMWNKENPDEWLTEIQIPVVKKQ